MNLELKNKWLAALRSGEYKQATGWLHDICSGGYCCLGVLACISGSDNEELQDCGSLSTLGRIELLGPRSEEISALEDQLMSLNDVELKSFDEIADWIEENVEAA